MANDGLNIDFGEMYAFDMVDGDKTVGQMNVSVHKQKTSSRGESQIYPDSWFIGDTEQLKPVLEIDGFGTVGNQGGGYGRAGLQRAYEMSLEKGCDGRVEVHATWGAGKFYEHCGFVGKNGEKSGKPGIKYFEPTEENVAALYKGDKREDLSLQTAKPMDFGDIDIDALLAEAEIEQPVKRLRDVEQIFLVGNTQVESKADLAKIVEEPCLAVCEDLYDKNILTYWSSANKNAPDRAYVLIRYESLDDNNKKIADDLIAQGVLSDAPKYNFDSYNTVQEYGKALYLGIDTNPDMEVAEISENLRKIAAEFAPQDIKYNVYTPEYLLENSFGKKPETFAFPSLKTAVCGEKLSDDYKPEREAVLTSIKIMMMQKQATGLTTEDMREVADKIDWLYNKENGCLYKDKETLRRHNEYIKQYNKDSRMVNFTDIVNFKYNEPEVDKDIKQMLETGKFHPAYADVVREFLAPEIANCKKSVDDNTHHLQVHIHGPMCEDALTRTPQELNLELDWLGFNEEKRKFWYDYFVHPKFGRQKAPPLSILQNGDKKLIMYPFGLSRDAFYSVYTEIHELTHGMQAKYDAEPKEDEYLKEHYELLYQGKSRDEAKAIQEAENPHLKDYTHYGRCINEMQANSAATTYMMLKAVETGDKDLITKVEKRLLNESASMSGALMNERLGLAYFEYPATKKIIEEVKQGKCAHLLNEDGLLNWSELYKYTKDKVAEMGYSKEDMNESLNTAKMLKEIRAKYPDSKEEFLSAVEKEAMNMPHPHNKIFSQFVEAQRDYTPDSSQNLHRFYDYLGVKDNREALLQKADSKNVPNIEEYRQIYVKSKLLQQKMQVQLINKVR